MQGLSLLTKFGCFLEIVLYLMIAGSILFIIVAYIYDFMRRRAKKNKVVKDIILKEDDIRAIEFIDECYAKLLYDESTYPSQVFYVGKKLTDMEATKNE